jgi:ubiquinone/menaquinone biosynthesis C-methylase UbiE
VAESKPDTSAAEAYESILVPEVFAPWAEILVREAQIPEGARTLDVACGTGVVARRAERLVGARGRSTGIDIDPAMIEVAKAAALREGVQIDYLCASASELPFEAASFDVVLCQQGLQYFPEKEQALAELHRVMRPNARLVAATWTEMQECAGNWAMITALERRNIDAKDMRKPFSLSDHAAMRTLAEAAGFEDVTVQTVRRLARFPSVKAFVEAIGQGAPSSRHALAKVPPQDWSGFVADVETQLAPWSRGGQLEFPMASNILSARR